MYHRIINGIKLVAKLSQAVVVLLRYITLVYLDYGDI